MENLSGRVALVTGGSGGLGTAICQALAEAGVAVVVGYNASQERAEKLSDSLPPVKAGHRALLASVTDSTALASLASEIDTAYGHCDILVNCAGTTRFVAHNDLD